MTTVLRMLNGSDFLGSRKRALVILERVEEELTRPRARKVVLDFAGVSGMSHSFTDELLSRLDELAAERSVEVVFVNCTPAVAEAVELVSDMHDIEHVPSCEPGQGRRSAAV